MNDIKKDLPKINATSTKKELFEAYNAMKKKLTQKEAGQLQPEVLQK